jgi:hypothetical protein
MRRLVMIAIGLAALEGTAGAQSMYSEEFVPPTAAERAQLSRAKADVLPSDVRRDPGAHAASTMFWTGVTDGVEGGAAMVEHHYYDGVVEGGGGVWLSPWGEGRFCLLGVPADVRAKFTAERPRFVRAYGQPVVTELGLCLRNVSLAVGDRPWSTTVIEYGPDANAEFSESDARARGAIHRHPEARLLTPLSYRLLAGAHIGKTNFDDSPLGVGWNAAGELSLRASLRVELALMAGTQSYPKFAAPTAIQTALLFRTYQVGAGIAFGPLLSVPVHDDEKLFIGGRYLPTFGEALGSWGLSPVIGGGMDVSASPDGDVRFLIQLVIGVDGNVGSPRR